MKFKNQSGDYRQFGIILIVIGILGVLFKTNLIGWENIWPLFIIGGGIGFFAGYFKNRNERGLLMPATILTIYGFLFLYCSNGHWGQMSDLWPTFILAPGLGFFAMHYIGRGERTLLIPGSILIIISGLFYLDLWMIIRWWPVILILAGIYLILKNRQKTKQNENVTLPSSSDRKENGLKVGENKDE